MALLPTTRFMAAFKPLTQITPTTFRDGYTFLDLYENLRKFLEDVLTPELDAKLAFIYEQTQAEVDRLTLEMNASVGAWDELFTLFMDNVTAELEALNDQASASLVANDLSMLSQALTAKFATLTSVATDIETVNQEIGRVETSIPVKTAATLGASASVVARRTETWGTYEVVRVFTHGQNIPGLIDKKYPNEYQLQGTSGNGFRPGAYPESLTSVHRRTGSGVIVNADGVNASSASPNYNVTDAVQIKDGVIYHDFMDPDTYYRGHDALGFKWDGSVEFYSSKLGHTAAYMVEDGVKDSFCFGPAFVVNGVKQTITNPDRSSRQILGVLPDGDLLIISTSGVSGPSGPTYQEAADLAHSWGVKHAIPLDGGGSTQTLLEGRYMHPSSDVAGARPIGGSFLLVNARVTGDTGTTWQEMSLINGFTHHTTPGRFRVKDGDLLLSGAVINTDPVNGIGARVCAKLPWYATPATYYRTPLLDGATNQQYCDVSASGEVIVSTVTEQSAARYLSVVRAPMV